MTDREAAMEKYTVRYEQKRGHYLVIEGTPPFTRGNAHEMQLRMLQTCSIPGLLKLETEEIDGRLSLRYSLAGVRMLSQTIRTEKWSMTEWMTSLCRLAEVMEDCRLYVLDADQLILRDDLIFVGEGWQDLQIVYLPMTAIERQGASGKNLEILMVRWMMRVSDPDGPVIQRALRMAASPDFTPAMLRRFARQYLSEASETVKPQSVIARPAEAPVYSPTGSAGRPTREDLTENARPAPTSWRWFQPPAGEPHSLSGLLGDDSGPLEFEEFAEKDRSLSFIPLRRQRIWLVCAAAGLIAIAWHVGYGKHPGRESFLFSIGITLVSLTGLVIMWNRGFSGIKKKQQETFIHKHDERLMASSFTEVPERRELPEQQVEAAMEFTVGLSSESERTQLLEANRQMTSVCYLEWESAAPPLRISLDKSSLVIGRSQDAASHVDDTPGVSRAHAELIRTKDGWTAKDLGSRNGSRINQQPMVPYEPYLLRAEDNLEIAGSRYRFVTGRERSS